MQHSTDKELAEFREDLAEQLRAAAAETVATGREPLILVKPDRSVRTLATDRQGSAPGAVDAALADAGYVYGLRLSELGQDDEEHLRDLAGQPHQAYELIAATGLDTQILERIARLAGPDSDSL